MNLGDSYIREGHRDDAAEAYAEAGSRFSRLGKNDDAIRALMKGHDIRPNDLRILDGLVKAYAALGRVGKAVHLLEDILEDEPYNRDVLYLLIDCHIESQNANGAEKAVIKLVELEPANYPKLLDLIRIYLNADDLDSAARILSMSSEYLLAAGQGDECKRWITEILERDPNHVAGLRLLVRHASWAQEEMAFTVSLVRLAEAAKNAGEASDERYALSQLVIVRPFESEYAERLRAINAENGFEEEPVDAELVKAQFKKFDTPFEMPQDDQPTPVSVVEHNGFHTANDLSEYKLRPIAFPPEFEHNAQVVEETLEAHLIGEDEPGSDLGHSDEQRLQKEIESVAFYIDNDYRELAEKAIGELTAEFGDRPEIQELSDRLSEVPAEHHVEVSSLGIDEIRSEFGLEDSEAPVDGDDFETHYHTAVAYQEMGLTEDAIKEFQDAINLTRPDDGTRRFFQCANLLGHCFSQNGMGNLAVTWFSRALETPDLSDDETQGLWYELALAYDADGDHENSSRYFEQVYAENVDFRDVAERVKNSLVGH